MQPSKKGRGNRNTALVLTSELYENLLTIRNDTSIGENYITRKDIKYLEMIKQKRRRIIKAKKERLELKLSKQDNKFEHNMLFTSSKLNSISTHINKCKLLQSPSSKVLFNNTRLSKHKSKQHSV